MILYAPAKINLCLKVLGKRPDGYHNIETLFERIDLSDKIVLRNLQNDGIKVFCDHPDVPVGKTGLVYRAINLLKRNLKISKGVEVRIFKRIPVASGLGGGSSDAASILIGVNRLWKLSLGLPDLVRYGRELGSDIPFFLRGCSFAMGRGRGDEVMPLGWKMKLWHLIICFPIKLLSKDIYGAYKKRASSSLNDLEDIILEKAPAVAKLKKVLNNIGLTHSLVSGSGPSVFSLFEKRKEAIRARGLVTRRFPLVREKGYQIFIVPTL